MPKTRPIFYQYGRTKIVLLNTLISASLIMLGCGWIVKNEQFQLLGNLISHVETNKKIIALTFDDGPKAGRTQKILDILNHETVPATFYLNGLAMKNNPKETKLLVESGHELGNHSYNHPRMLLMSYADVADEIESTDKILREFGYQGDISFRPPFGKSLFMLPLYLKNNNITTVTWNVAPEYFNGSDTPEAIYQRTIEQVKPGSIILLHVMYGNGSSLAAVPKIIRSLKDQGYEFKTVDQLINES